MPRLSNKRSCQTCRRRKIKCDENVPNCQRCEKAGYMCDRSTQFRQGTVGAGNIAIDTLDPGHLLQDPDIASLFHTYVKDLAPWYDLNDMGNTFSLEVASRALSDRLLFFAIIGLSACCTARRTATSPEIAEVYHRECIAILMTLSADDRRIQDGTALAATCLLRSYEILSEHEDPNRHLFGASTMLPASITGLQDNSLVASGFWNYLREDITFSLIHRCPLKIKIGMATSGSITTASIANAMTTFLAHAINLYFCDDDNRGELRQLHAEATSCWSIHKPTPFTRYQNQQDDFPTIKYLRDTDVAAHHYFAVIQCLASTQNRSDTAAEICGLAISSLSSAVVVNAYGPICFTAQWLDNIPQKNTPKRWLHNSRSSTGWTVEPIVRKLEQGWHIK